MSKAVRIRDHLHAEIERLARQNRRTLIDQLELLLEQAIAMTGLPEGEGVGHSAVSGSALPMSEPERVSPSGNPELSEGAGAGHPLPAELTGVAPSESPDVKTYFKGDKKKR